MDRPVQAEKPQTEPQETRSLLGEAFHAGAGFVFGEKSKVTEAVTTYGPEALYTGALFFPGAKAVGASALIGALNEVKTNDSLQDGALNAVLGSIKGGATKYTFDKLGNIEFTKSMLNAPIKGVVMGSASTFINTGLSRDTYMHNGKFDFSSGVDRTLQSVFSPQALVVDAATFGLASGASVGLNKVTGGFLARSPGLSMMLTGSTFGIASGGINEISKQAASGNGFDIGKIASQAAIHGAVDGLAAGPAGFKVGFTPRPLPDLGTKPTAVAGTATKPLPEPLLDSGTTTQSPDSASLIVDGEKASRNTTDQAKKPKGARSETAPSFVRTTLTDGATLNIDNVPKNITPTQEFEPKRLTATDADGRRITITKTTAQTASGMSEWSIRAPNGSTFKVEASVKMTGRDKLTISGRTIDVSAHSLDEVVSMFVTKPDITPGIKAQLDQMEEILAPLTDPKASIDQRNRALSDIHDFERNHRSPTLETAIQQWLPNQAPEIQHTLSRYYDNPTKESVRQSGFLRDTAFQMMREGSLDPAVIEDITKFTDRIEKTDRLSDQQKDETVKNVLKLLDDGNDPRMHEAERAKPIPQIFRIAAIQSAMHSANPDTVTQYAHSTCALASLEVTSYARAPEAATKLVSDVLRTGKFVTTDGTVIQIDPFSLRPEYGSDKIDAVAMNEHWTPDQFRSYSSQVFQTAAANVYWQTRMVNPDGDPVPKGSLRYELRYDPVYGKDSTPVGYVVDYSGPRIKTWEAGGYRQNEVTEIGDLISHNINFDSIPDHAYDSLDAFKDYLTRAPRDQMPVSIGVDARYLSDDLAAEPDSLGHRINIQSAFDPVGPGGRDKWMVAIKNPWNGRAEFISIRQLYEMSYMRPGFKGPLGQDTHQVVPITQEIFNKATKRGS